MAKLLSVKIDVTKIEKSKLYSGKKGTYLDLVVSINDEVDQYGNNVSTWQQQTEEERKSKQKKNYLGNGKVFWTNENQETTKAEQIKGSTHVLDLESDSPF